MRQRLRHLSAAAVLAIALWSGPASADGAPEDARVAYAAGDFRQAAALAGLEDNAEAQTLSARALLAEAVTSDTAPVDRLLDQAERQSRRAVDLAPQNLEARIVLAWTLGVKGRRAPIREAIARGYAVEGRRLIDFVLERDPGNAWAQALDGAWNFEILRRGGAAGAVYYGARRSRGVAAFDRARTLAPGDPVVAFQYAVALLELDGAAAAPQARRLLAVAGACTTQDAFEARIARAARDAAQVLAANGPEAAVREASGRIG